ncbi:hypothetical protein BpHYR1_029809 [Brachionus plicatilis]|uniref:Uncharacterized protein n=1 Tax=Brachionus plicatilis TaxID=10195 RepID=A0A3M7SSE3_BRAPC|nr:hypothetical protein BpHYR1_029809 [Brachionus plicatilis]
MTKRTFASTSSALLLYTIPLENKNLPMGEKLKRGAPKKATKALVRINFFYSQCSKSFLKFLFITEISVELSSSVCALIQDQEIAGNLVCLNFWAKRLNLLILNKATLVLK